MFACTGVGDSGSISSWQSSQIWTSPSPCSMPRTIEPPGDTGYGSFACLFVSRDTWISVPIVGETVGDDGLVLLTLGHSGIRWGELTALRKSRCHLLRRRLEVAENVVELRGEIVFGTPKGHERRQVAIPPFLCDLLAEHLARNVQDNDGLVFTRNGGPLRHTPFYKRTFKPAAARAGLPAALRMHDLRHTCASILIREGANIVQVQKQLGHKDATTTLNTYAHMWPDDLDRVADALERAHAQALSDPGRDADGTEVVTLDRRRRSEAQ